MVMSNPDLYPGIDPGDPLEGSSHNISMPPHNNTSIMYPTLGTESPSTNATTYVPFVSTVSAVVAGDCSAKFTMQYRIYRIIIDVFLVGIICIVGFIGNALCIAVLRRDRERKNTTNWLLQTLAFSDTLYLVACVLFQTVKGINDYTNWFPWINVAFPYMEPYIWAFASIAQTITVWLVMLVTMDRYIAICKPLKTQMRTLQRAKLAVTIVIIAAVIYNIPRFMERKIVYLTDSCTNTTIVKSKKTALRENPHYFLVYKTILYFIFRAVGPLITLIGLNLQLINALQAVRRKHRDMKRSPKNKDNITLMLVVVVSIFIICEIPDLILRVIVTIKEFTPAWQISLTRLRYANAITNMMLTVNSSINFLIYCLIGSKFRKILRQMCCGPIKGGGTEISEIEPLNTRTTTAATCGTSVGPGALSNGTSTGGKRNGMSKATGEDVAL